jgi:hypothetical protein
MCAFKRWTLDAGRWTLDAGRWTLDAGRWTLDAGLWTLDAGRWTLDAGRWTLDTGHWTLDTGRWTLDAGRWKDVRRMRLPVEGVICCGKQTSRAQSLLRRMFPASSMRRNTRWLLRPTALCCLLGRACALPNSGIGGVKNIKHPLVSLSLANE